MELHAGARLAHYQIVGPLGAGGMGEVYRATDTKLKREVAIKILPPQFAEQPARLARFEQEAVLLASLNHPHVAAIYGVEHVDNVPCLVLELVEGPTLADRLLTGPIPARRQSQGARLRPREGLRRRAIRARRRQCIDGSSPPGHRGRRRDGNGVVHEPGAGRGQARR